MIMLIITILLLTVLVSACGRESAAPHGGTVPIERPNILLIVADDMGYEGHLRADVVTVAMPVTTLT
jgi:hypothetical protein